MTGEANSNIGRRFYPCPRGHPASQLRSKSHRRQVVPRLSCSLLSGFVRAARRSLLPDHLRRWQRDPSPAFLLRFIQPLVGAGQEGVFAVAVGGPGGYAHADRGVDGRFNGKRGVEVGEALDRGGGVGFRKEDEELVAAET